MDTERASWDAMLYTIEDEISMMNIFKTEIPLDELKLNAGIYEFHKEDNKSIGVSYETVDDKPVYIFNLFIDDEYIDIDGEYEDIYDAIETVTKIWNEWQ